jgi:hypothetical protein
MMYILDVHAFMISIGEIDWFVSVGSGLDGTILFIDGNLFPHTER